MKKRLLFIMLALTLTLSLALAAGCKNSGTSSDDSSNPIDSPSAPIDSASSPDDSSSTGGGSSSAECEHAFGDWIVDVAATCTEKGAKHRVCSKCDAVENDEIVAAGHSFGDWITDTEPSCTAKGAKHKECANCDAALNGEIDMVAHDYGDWVTDTEPTCTEKGAKHKTCKNCTDTVNEDVPATHTVGDDGVCTVCDAICIATADDLMALLSKSGIKKIEFLNDIDMAGKVWTGFMGGTEGPHFAPNGITISGNGHSISNLCAPLIAATTYDVTINNLSIKDSEMEAFTDYFADYGRELSISGAFLAYSGYVKNVTLKNCSLQNVKMTATDAKWAGGLVGYIAGGDDGKLAMENCSVDGLVISAKGSVGGLVGHSISEIECKNCSVKNSNITATEEDWRIGSFIGTLQKATGISGAVSTGNTLVMNDSENEGQQIANPGHELFGRIVGGTLEIDGAVYTTAAKLKAVLTASNNVTLDKDYILLDDWTSLLFSEGSVWALGYTLDGNGHKISGLTMPLLGPSASQKISISNLTIADSNIGSDASNAFHNAYHSGAFIAAVDTGATSVSLLKCHTDNVNVIGSEGGGSSAGLLVGYIYMIGANDGYGVRTVSIVGCTVTGGSVTNSNGNAAGIVGMCATSPYVDAAGNACRYEIQDCAVNGCKIVGENEKKTATIVGTVNNGGTLNISGCEAQNCITASDVALTNVYGRIVDLPSDPVTPTYVVIDGVKYGVSGVVAE